MSIQLGDDKGWETVKTKKSKQVEKKKTNTPQPQFHQVIDREAEGWETVPKKRDKKKKAAKPSAPNTRIEVVTTEDLERNEQLKSAIEKGDWKSLKRVLSQESVNSTIGDGMTPLHFACSVKLDEEVATKVVQTLLEIGANVNAPNTKDNTKWNEPYQALHYAVEREDPELTKILLSKGAQPAGLNNIMSFAILHGSRPASVVKVLLDHGANPNYNRTPGGSGYAILDAVSRSDVSLVRLLLDNGADVNCKGVFGRTLLHEACKKGNIDLVQLLLERGADTNLRAPNTKGQGGYPALFDALASPAAKELAKILNEYGADHNVEADVPVEKNGKVEIHKWTGMDFANSLEDRSISKFFLKKGVTARKGPVFKTWEFFSKEDFTEFKKWWDSYSKQKKAKSA